MKLSKLQAIVFSVVALCVSGCQIEKPYEAISGVDSTKAKPTEFMLDEDNSSSDGISVYWNGTEAVKQGATTFTCQLVKEIGGAGDNYNSTVTKTIAAQDAVGNINDAASFSKLTNGATYYVRVRANYPYSVFSEWVYLTRQESIVQISIGNGFVLSDFVAPQDFVVTPVTYSKVNAKWTMIAPAGSYEVSYKKSENSDWTIADTTSSGSLQVKRLEQLTSYDFRVRAFKPGEKGAELEATDYTVVSGIITPEKPDFDPEIKDADQLARFFEEIASQAGDADVYKLMNDIDLAGVNIVPAASFAGIFDGQGFKIKNANIDGRPVFETSTGTIKNLVIDKSCQATGSAGRFGILVGTNDGSVLNIVNNASISMKDYSAVTYLGGIVGYSTGLVKDCVNNGDITIEASTTAGNSLFAGVVGGFKAPKGTVAVENCKNSGNISYSVTGTPKNPIVAGVVGGTTPTKTGTSDSNRGNAAPNVGIVSNCENSGKVAVSWTVSATGSYSNVGGVAGYMEGDIENCVNKGDVSLVTPDTDKSVTSTRPAIGGIAGFVMYSAKNCNNHGKISARGVYSGGTNGNAGAGSSHQALFGGVFGGIGAGAEVPVSGIVMEKCNNYGAIDFKVVMKDAAGTQAKAAGVAAYCGLDVVKDCHNYSDISFAVNFKVQHVGGILGQAYANKIEGCTNEGAVTYNGRAAELGANENNFFSYQTYFGGIVGYISAGCAVVNCENKAEVKMTDVVTTKVLSYMGGINGSYKGSFTMTDCKNTGKITSAATASLIGGGMSGAFNGTMTDCVNTGDISAPNCSPASGKESEIGGMTGYANAKFYNCTNKGTITTGPSGTYAGGLIGGMGAADLLVYGCAAEGALEGSASRGAILGRYRDVESGKFTLYYSNCTFAPALSGLPIVGTPNKSSVVEGEKPEA